MDAQTVVAITILLPMTIWSIYALLFHLGVSKVFE